MSADISQLDRVLAHYGQQAKPARDLERDLVMGGIASIWSERSFHAGELNSCTMKEKGARFFNEIHRGIADPNYPRSVDG